MQTPDPTTYASLLDSKLTQIQTLFSDMEMPEIEVFSSDPLHFRYRTEFRIWHTKGRCFYAMFERGKNNDPHEVVEFPIASTRINEIMTPLMETVNQQDILSRKLFQIEFLTTLSGDALVTLIYHKALNEEWEQAAKALQDNLNVHVIGRSRKQKLVLEKDWVLEELNIDGKTFKYQQIEGGFTQPNAKMNEKMLSWAQHASTGLQGDLLELYCGNGNFSIALAGAFNQVVATEISKTSIKAAQYNKDINNIDNLHFVRMSAEEFTQAIQKQREFRRLKDIDLDSYDFQTVLVDPPRAGLDDESVKMIQQYNNIIYISCNPETLKNNLETLTKTHDIEHYAIFDQFPYTHHIESGVLLKKR
ncbi:tRNA (uridine(54)-C5)-methyltransferase TrmA [Gammaproteobacteria bacterium 45_16_T64]|nr:tRNA (uridine(54)-C5)-methyltransferase TrmA [Gammaproteobacteria bacterium 45_16_T64]